MNQGRARQLGLAGLGAGLLAGLAIGTALGHRAGQELPGLLPNGDLGGTARETLAAADPLDRSFRWTALLQRSPADAMPLLRDAIGAAPLDLGDPEVVAFAMWWARFDPKAALEWTRSEWRAQSRLVVASVFRVWAHREPELAYSEIAKIPEFHHEAAIDATIVGWHESGKPGLVEHVQSLPDNAFRQRVGERLARRLVLALGAEAATRWLETLREPGFREAMTMRVASAAAEQGDAAAIAAWAAPRVTSGEQRPSGFPRRIGTRWILRDSEAALAWLASLPPGIDRDDGVMESYRDWMRFAPGASLHWIQNAQLERWSEPAFSIYARSLSKDRPQEALALVARFSDETLRNRITTVIARGWMTRDPKAAAEWLARADLPSDVRARAMGTPKAGRTN